MRKVLERYLGPGDTFLDLGANEGYFTVQASRIVGPSGRVIAIEPQSRLQGVIAKNVAANECFNVNVVSCLVTDKSGTREMFIAPSINTGSSSIFRSTKYSLPTEAVRSYSLADLISKLGVERCDLMKVDIEGAEWDVFMPAEEILRKGILRNIALEFHPSILEKRGLRPEELHQCMIRNGYQMNDELGPRVYSFIG